MRDVIKSKLELSFANILDFFFQNFPRYSKIHYNVKI